MNAPRWNRFDTALAFGCAMVPYMVVLLICALPDPLEQAIITGFVLADFVLFYFALILGVGCIFTPSMRERWMMPVVIYVIGNVALFAFFAINPFGIIPPLPSSD